MEKKKVCCLEKKCSLLDIKLPHEFKRQLPDLNLPLVRTANNGVEYAKMYIPGEDKEKGCEEQRLVIEALKGAAGNTQFVCAFSGAELDSTWSKEGIGERRGKKIREPMRENDSDYTKVTLDSLTPKEGERCFHI